MDAIAPKAPARRGKRVRATLGLTWLVALSANAAAADYIVLTSGQPSGTMSVTPAGDERRILFRFIDRGRGPDLNSTVVTDASGMLRHLKTSGVNYYKLPVDERFQRNGSSASWKAANDSGTSEAPAYYLPDERTPEHLAMLARKLLREPGGKVPLLPDGQAGLTRLLERELAVNGKTVQARLYAITGLSFSPEPLWLDEHGELLLQGSDWFAVVHADLEPHAKELIKLQRQALADAARARTEQWLRRPPKAIAITNVDMFDASSRSVRRGMTVVVVGNRIASVVPAATARIPTGAKLIDGRGKTLLPGLWDMHVHLSNDVQGLLHLAAGVTSVRDLANNADELAERRGRYDAMELAGPRVLPAGFIDGPGPLAGPIKVLAASPEELQTAIQAYAARGYKAIKLYSSLDPKLVPVAIKEAHRLGMRVSGHVPAGMTMRDVVEAGFDEVHHINFVALNFMGPEINAKTNGITRITAMAERGWEIDPNSTQVAGLVSLLKSRGTVVDPTLSIYEDLLGRPGQVDPRLAVPFDRLPPVVRRSARGGALATNESETSRNARSFHALLGLVKALYDGGVTLVAGTDATSGFSYHRELELYEQAGIPRGDILHIATLGAARVAAADKELGSIDEGKLADLVLVCGNPAERMSDIRNAALVIKDGIPIDPAMLYKEVGVAARGCTAETRQKL